MVNNHKWRHLDSVDRILCIRPSPAARLRVEVHRKLHASESWALGFVKGGLMENPELKFSGVYKLVM